MATCPVKYISGYIALLYISQNIAQWVFLSKYRRTYRKKYCLRKVLPDTSCDLPCETFLRLYFAIHVVIHGARWYFVRKISQDIGENFIAKRFAGHYLSRLFRKQQLEKPFANCFLGLAIYTNYGLSNTKFNDLSISNLRNTQTEIFVGFIKIFDS